MISNMIPNELKAKKQWVNYLMVPDPDSDKPKKKPINPLTGNGAMSNNPSTWTDYDTAVDAMERYGFSGLGYMFVKDDGIVGVDIDHCYDPVTKKLNSVAEAIISHQPTYAEFSPSGTGVHLFYKGTKPTGGSKNTENGVEMYDSGRYFTMTGNKLEGAPDEIADGDETLAWIHETFIKKQKKAKKSKKNTSSASIEMTDEELIEKASSAEGGDVFAELLSGNWQGKYQSQSEADMALCMKLAFWSGKNREQMERIFKASGLYRQKWDEQHHADGQTYGEETLNRAIEMVTDVYSPATGDDPVFELKGRYWRVKGDNTYPLTNFILDPIEMIKADEDTQLTADLVTVYGERFPMKFMTSDFANPQRFKNLLSKNTIALAYLGGEGDLELLKSFVSKLDWTVKFGVKAMGIYMHEGRLVFVSKDGAIEKGGVVVDNIVQLERHKSIDSNILRTDPLKKEALPDLGKWLMSYNEPAKAISILAWAAACFLKEQLRLAGVKFPMLFLIGEAGSGKSTTLERVLMPIFSIFRVTAASQVTAFTLMKESASSNMIPFTLDEFKPSKMDKNRLSFLYNHFRDAYDGHDGMRGRIDQTVMTYNLSAPMIVAGEESADETAIRERSIELLFSKKDLKDADHRTAFNSVIANAHMLEDFGRSLLDEALGMNGDTCFRWYSEGQKLFSKELPSRVVSNLACCYVGLKLLEKLCKDYGYGWDTVFPYHFDICVKYLEHAAKNYLLDGGTGNKSIVEQTFEIMSRAKLDPKVHYTIDGEKLYLWLSPSYDIYTRYRKDYAILGESLLEPQFKKQLKASEYYIDHNFQKRIGSENRKCWVVNIEKLAKNCDVSGFFSTEVVPLT